MISDLPFEIRTIILSEWIKLQSSLSSRFILRNLALRNHMNVEKTSKIPLQQIDSIKRRYYTKQSAVIYSFVHESFNYHVVQIGKWSFANKE